MTTTTAPVVLIHGVLGYGRRRPLAGSWSPYWPESALQALNANHLIVDVGVLSSDHDRACEVFYQLIGGRVDYGEQHSEQAGHARFGANFSTALHPNWSADKPVHLVGHSFGATTALELYQLLCMDYFGVGSDYRWVTSLVSIAGPLSGTTLPHLFGLHEKRMVPYSLGHAIGAVLGVWFKLHCDYPLLRQAFEFRMPQWELVTSLREVLSPHGRINGSTDLAVFDIQPKERMRRNARLQHMDKLFLVSVATSNHAEFPGVELAQVVSCAVLGVTALVAYYHDRTVIFALTLMAALALLRVLRWRVRALDYAAIPSLYALLLLLRRHVRGLHVIFEGFDREEWRENDGLVNLHSMLQPWPARDSVEKPLEESMAAESDTESTTSSASSSVAESWSKELGSQSPRSQVLVKQIATSELASGTQETMGDGVDRCSSFKNPRTDEMEVLDPLDPKTRPRLHRGKWYVHHVRKNHMAGTHFDSHAPELYEKLFALLASHFEAAEASIDR